MAYSDILTGQFVRISQTPASVADRIVGRIIDGVVIVVYLIALVFSFDNMSKFLNDVSSDLFIVLFVFTVRLPIWGYSFLCEWLFGGQTLGKFIMRTKVVMVDGSQPTVGALLLRWMLESIDIYFSFMGLVVIIFTKRHQRIGDLAAGTMVIRRPDETQMTISLREFSFVKADYVPVYQGAERLSAAQADVIARVLGNAMQKGSPQNMQKAAALATKVKALLGIETHDPDLTFLQNILNDYRHHAMQIV